ncbi:MAG: serine hydrolase domain-containing protein [Planctomycetota bacterium]
MERPGTLALAPLLLTCLACSVDREARVDAAPTPEDPAVDAALEEVFGSGALPGGVAAIARAGEPIRAAAFGVRSVGRDEAFTVDDLVHIGSDTKAMTAALCARLVERGDLGWSTTLEERLPDLAEEVDVAFRGATLLQFLRHTSGAPANADWGAHAELPLGERRRRIAADALSGPPGAKPGAAFLYSNLGYMVAGLMAEEAGAAPWEELILSEVAAPLGITTMGFGAPGPEGEYEQPWGHRSLGDARIPLQSDNDPALGPAGTVHLSMADWSRFVLAFTEPGRVEGFLGEESFAQLLEVGLDDYACGWAVTRRPWAGGAALMHAGSNTMWFALTWVAPVQGRAFLVAVNAAPDEAQAQCDRMIGELLALDAPAEGR